jgi:hypothetical protein
MCMYCKLDIDTFIVGSRQRKKTDDKKDVEGFERIEDRNGHIGCNLEMLCFFCLPFSLSPPNVSTLSFSFVVASEGHGDTHPNFGESRNVREQSLKREVKRRLEEGVGRGSWARPAAGVLIILTALFAFALLSRLSQQCGRGEKGGLRGVLIAAP